MNLAVLPARAFHDGPGWRRRAPLAVLARDVAETDVSWMQPYMPSLMRSDWPEDEFEVGS